jgi:hypothetical protein
MVFSSNYICLICGVIDGGCITVVVSGCGGVADVCA